MTHCVRHLGHMISHDLLPARERSDARGNLLSSSRRARSPIGRYTYRRHNKTSSRLYLILIMYPANRWVTHKLSDFFPPTQLTNGASFFVYKQQTELRTILSSMFIKKGTYTQQQFQQGSVVLVTYLPNIYSLTLILLLQQKQNTADSMNKDSLKE